MIPPRHAAPPSPPPPPQPPAPGSRPLRRAALRYGVAGLANTAVTLAVIVALDLVGGVDAMLANALGFAAGLILAFVLGHYFVFDRRGPPTATTGYRYAIAVAVAFLVNQLVLAALLAILPDASFGRIIAQFAAMAAYSVTMFSLSYRWIFASQQ